MQLQPNYIVDNNNHKIAVQLDIKTYEKIIIKKCKSIIFFTKKRLLKSMKNS